MTLSLVSSDTPTGSPERIRNKGKPSPVVGMDDSEFEDLHGPAEIRCYEYAEYCSTALPESFPTIRLKSVSNVLLLWLLSLYSQVPLPCSPAHQIVN